MPALDNVYESDVDFTTLALRYPDFAKKLKSNRQLDFSDPESVRQLTKCLLHRDFDLSIELPDDRLCPPVPNRFNYILFIQRLLDSTSPDFHEGYDLKRQVIGLDIGTGSSAIYPLLACRQRPAWRFLATEIDTKNRQYATQNIASNNLQYRIRILDTDPSGEVLIPTTQIARLDDDVVIDILMTNPPFYASQSSLLESARQKSRPPNSSCTGAAVEMITPGGEVAFIAKLITESALPRNRRRIQWFSAMTGKLSSVGAVVEILRREKCSNFAVAEFIQGQKTRRWCVAWSWWGHRPSNAVARSIGSSGVEKKYLPPVTEVEFEAVADGKQSQHAMDVDGRPGVDKIVSDEISRLDGVKWRFDPGRQVGLFMSRAGDVWSRKARRKNLKPRQKQPGASNGGEQEPADTKMASDSGSNDDDEEDEDEDEPALVARISLRQRPTPTPKSTTTTTMTGTVLVHVRHLQGHDAVLFESFCGWLKRKVTAVAAS